MGDFRSKCTDKIDILSMFFGGISRVLLSFRLIQNTFSNNECRKSCDGYMITHTCLLDARVKIVHFFIVCLFLFLIYTICRISQNEYYQIRELTASFLNHFLSSEFMSSHSLSAIFPNLELISDMSSNIHALAFKVFAIIPIGMKFRYLRPRRTTVEWKERTGYLPSRLQICDLPQSFEKPLL